MAGGRATDMGVWFENCHLLKSVIAVTATHKDDKE